MGERVNARSSTHHFLLAVDGVFGGKDLLRLLVKTVAELLDLLPQVLILILHPCQDIRFYLGQL